MKIKLLILSFAFAGMNAIIAQSLNIPLVTVNETEIAYAQVDEIHFTLSIRTHSKEIQNARNKNRVIAESVFEYLSKKKIPKQYIQTKRMRISRNYTRNRPPREYDGFITHQDIYVCLKNLNDYDEIIDSLLTMKVESISGPDFKSSTYEKTLKAARLAALKKARISAMEMAGALGQKIGKAKLINVIYSNNSNSAYSTQTNSGTNPQSGNSSFEVGEMQIAASVEVSFELLE